MNTQKDPPDRTDAYNAYIFKNRRWNFFANAADLSAVNLAGVFIFSTTILTLYASYLTASAVLIGLVPGIQQVGYLLPQLLGSNKAERLARNKPFVVKLSIFERIPYLFVTLGIFFLPGIPGWVSYLILLFSIITATGAAGLATPAWKNMLGKVIHPDRRGALFATGLSVGGFMGIGGTLLARRIMETRDYPETFALFFLLSFIFQTISWLFLTLNREPPLQPASKQISHRDYFRQLPGILKNDRNFTRFLIGSTLLILGQMAVSFYILYAMERFSPPDGFAAELTMVALISQTLGTPLLGRLGDRLGHKFLSQVSAGLIIITLLLLLFLPGLNWMYAVFFLMNLGMNGIRIARHAISMEFGSPEKLPTYTALLGTLLGLPVFLTPIIGGAILDTVGYIPLFITALLFNAAGILYLKLRVSDPRKPKA